VLPVSSYHLCVVCSITLCHCTERPTKMQHFVLICNILFFFLTLFILCSKTFPTKWGYSPDCQGYSWLSSPSRSVIIWFNSRQNTYGLLFHRSSILWTFSCGNMPRATCTEIIPKKLGIQDWYHALITGRS